MLKTIWHIQDMLEYYMVANYKNDKMIEKFQAFVC